MNNINSQYKKLNDLGFVGRGKSKHRPRNDPSLYGGNYPFIQTGDVKRANFYISEYTQTYNETGLAQSKLWNKGTLCITIAANIAENGILAIDACFPDSVIGFIPYKEKSDVRFVKYCLDTYKLQMQSISQGATQDNLSLDKLDSINFLVPQLKTQQQIADILTAYDDLIETNNQRIATLEAIAQQIYKEWFVRLRFPNWEHTPFHHGIPDGWEVKNFDTFCTLQRGYDLPDQDIKEGIYPVIASTSIKAYHSEYKVKPPVITTGRSGSLGTVIFSHQKSWVLNTALYVKNFHNNSPYLIFYTLKNLKLENFNAGAGVPSLNRNHLQAIKINVPPKDIQNQFDKIISDIFNQKVILEESNAILQKTRNLLLPRLISGKLTLKQATQQITSL